MKTYVLVDIGGTSIKYGLIDEGMKWLDKQVIDTQAQKGASHIMNKVKNIVRNYIKDYSLQAICISTAGVVDSQNGIIVHASKTIPEYTGTKIKELFESEFHIDCYVENDVNCAGYAEKCGGSGQDSQITVCLTVGTGIGGSLIIDHQLYNGTSFFAMEVGYMNVDGQCFEDIASTSALVRKVTALKNDGTHYDGRRIIALSQQNDIICQQAIDEMCLALAKGIANICYITNPDTIVLGGGLMEEKDYLYPMIDHYLKELLIPYVYQNLKLKFAYYKNDAGMIGAYFGYKNRRLLC